MGLSRRQRIVRTALMFLPVLFAVAALAGPAVARASAHPRRTRAVRLQRRSTFACLSLSVRSELLTFSATRGVVGVVAFDVDHDGDTDLVILRKDLRVHLWLNNGQGEFVRRDQSDSQFAARRKFRSGDNQQKGSCWFSSSYDDGSSLVGCAPARAAVPEPCGTYRLQFRERLTADPVLAATRTRGPPERIA
jgi:hypothetical protein